MKPVMKDLLSTYLDNLLGNDYVYKFTSLKNLDNKDIVHGIGIMSKRDPDKTQMIPVYVYDDFDDIKDRILERYNSFLK